MVPAERACAVIATAVKKIADATPPPGTRLPLEALPAAAPISKVQPRLEGRRHRGKAGETIRADHVMPPTSTSRC